MNPESSQELFSALSSPNVEGQAEFLRRFGGDLHEICESLAQAYSSFIGTFLETRGRNNKWVQAYSHAAVESCASAARMLVEGHVNGAGNTMRLGYEALCMAILLSSDSKVRIDGKEIDFLQEFENKDKRTLAFRSVGAVVANKKSLGLTEGDTFLEEAKKFYNIFSHASRESMASKIGPGGSAIIAGGYSSSNEMITGESLKFIGRLLNQLPDLIQVIYERQLGM